MTSTFKTTFWLGFAALLNQTAFSQQLTDKSLKKSEMESKEQGRIYFVDKFFVPKASINEFTKQVNYNRAFVANLSGYISGEAFEKPDSEGNLILMTIAVWENSDKVNQAKQAVQSEFKRIGFNPLEFYQRLNIKLEREEYRSLRE